MEWQPIQGVFPDGLHQTHVTSVDTKLVRRRINECITGSHHPVMSPQFITESQSQQEQMKKRKRKEEESTKVCVCWGGVVPMRGGGMDDEGWIRRSEESCLSLCVVWWNRWSCCGLGLHLTDRPPLSLYIILCSLYSPVQIHPQHSWQGELPIALSCVNPVPCSFLRLCVCVLFSVFLCFSFSFCHSAYI